MTTKQELRKIREIEKILARFNKTNTRLDKRIAILDYKIGKQADTIKKLKQFARSI